MNTSLPFLEWILLHGPALIVVLPLMAAVLVAILPSQTQWGQKLAWAAAWAVSIACALIGFLILMHVLHSGPVDYAMGGWEPPMGIAYRIDALNAPILLLIPIVALLCLLYALPSVTAEVEPKKRASFYAAFLVSFAGLLGMVATGGRV